MKKLTASRICKLKKKIKTWKVWTSKSMFGFRHYTDIMLYTLATSSEPPPDAIIYGLDVKDALRRFYEKQPWQGKLNYGYVDGRTFAKIAVLPNHRMHLKSCPWSLNLPKNVEFLG